MEKNKTPSRRVKAPFWRPNSHDDFVPYKCLGGWCVSIQYLGVWKYPTEQEAIDGIPALKNYRRSVLRQVELANEKYFRKLEIKQRELAGQLRTARTIKVKRYGTTHLTPVQKRALIRMIKAGADELTCKEKFDISTHVYSTLKQHYGVKNENTLQPDSSQTTSA